MKPSAFKLLSVLAVVAVPAVASADYVCSVSAFPGSAYIPYRLRVTFSTGSNCSGTTSTLWFCEQGIGPTVNFCAVDSLRFQRPELTGLFGQLARAADSQQQVFRATTTCGDGSSGCGHSVDFWY